MSTAIDALKVQVKENKKQFVSIVEQLKTNLDMLPDNRAIQRTGPNSFTMSQSSMTKNGFSFSPFTHDYKAQHLELKIMINNGQVKKMKDILDGKIVDQRRYADEVIEAARPTLLLAIELYESVK